MRLICLFAMLLLPVLPRVEAALDSLTPSAPVKDFRFPKFGANGYTQWVLQGSQGVYDGPDQISVEAMGLRVYTGDERMAIELSLDSPAAVLRLKENRAKSSEPIEISGANFVITGNGWTWDGNKKDIYVANNAQVEFEEAILKGGEETTGRTIVRSETLNLKTTVESYAFDFEGLVRAESEGLRLWSDRLIATADTPDGDREKITPVIGEFRTLRNLLAEGSVVMIEGNRRLKADRARFFPGTEMVELNGSVQVEGSGAVISGEQIRSEFKQVIVTGSASTGRAQMVLLRAGGLGLSGASSLDAITMIHADRIVMEEKKTVTEFEFEGRVEVFSGTLTLRAEALTVFSAPIEIQAAGADDTLPIGEVRELYARGSVYLEDSGMEVQSEKARFFPQKERAKLQGNPRLSDEGAVVSGAWMELMPEKAYVYGEANRPVRVLLPELPNLGYNPEPEAVEIEDPEIRITTTREATLIESNRLEMRKAEAGQWYIFEGAVSVSGTNLLATCHKMEVRASEVGEVAPEKDGLIEGTQINEIIGTGAVCIEQAGRVTRSDKAWIDPVGLRLILEGNAEVEDSRGQVRGERLVLNQGERRAIVEGGGDGKRARVTLPGLSQSED
ncbi:MAG: LPS-assembly protein LptD [Opitutia bacterium UBA7350]|nr:MAG: LPS-assembly protein LptD [Opitutae bacterium UBA7350]